MNQTTASNSSYVSSTGVRIIRSDTPDAHTDSGRYLDSLHSWSASEVNGMQAAGKIKNWLNNGDINAVLNISQLKLKSLPPLPANLKKLKAANNELASIAENHLPATLEAIDIHGNQLASLPESLPIAHLTLLNVAGNKLTIFPPIARSLNHECKVYFGKNNLDDTTLTAVFGPEQSVHGMRQSSSALEFVNRQTNGANELASAITVWTPINDFSLALLSKDVPGMISFTSFLNQMQTASFIKNASLRTAMAKLIKKTSCNADLCADVYKHTLKSTNLSTHRLACLFVNIKQLTIHADITNGLYNGRTADLVAFMRQEFRVAAIYHYARGRLQPENRESPEHQSELWGDIATFISPFINLKLEIEPVKTDNSESQMDIIELTQIVPNYIKDWENKQFCTFFSDCNSIHADLLRIADPQIKEIMAINTDSNGNKLQGKKLTEFHAEQINIYFARIGQPDLLGQVWPTIADPDLISFETDQVNVDLSDQADLSQLSPEQREQVQKCLIQ